MVSQPFAKREAVFVHVSGGHVKRAEFFMVGYGLLVAVFPLPRVGVDPVHMYRVKARDLFFRQMRGAVESAASYFAHSSQPGSDTQAVFGGVVRRYVEVVMPHVVFGAGEVVLLP
ncbi:hypothetical protein SDC9_197994 [bioreactor metagenome]|uniref:Uncharacterized protein n=1 Tax=bioreactor metagenome TaxID=1076179 RepID=A0A645IGD1_9ZZZZ